MEHFVCPVCGENLILTDSTYRCKNAHAFDCAKSGYVNLLQSQKSSKKRHGDDKLMVRSRVEFLEKGYYQPLLDGILEQCAALPGKMVHMVDVGCGEGWYTDGVFRFLRERGTVVRAEGIDISKDALMALCKRNAYIAAAVASVNRLPIESDSTDLILNLFAPHDAPEFARILKKGGVWLHAVPLEKHLFDLKAAIYDKPYENKVLLPEFDEFVLEKRVDIQSRITLPCHADIENLFRMTPYYYKTSVADQQKLAALDTLSTQIEFAILVYRKK